MTYYPDAQTRSEATGMYIEPYGQSWPDLAPLLTKIYTDRMAQFDFLPDNWLNNVMQEHGVDGNVLIPISPRTVLGLRSSAAPSWLDTQEKEDSWAQPASAAQAAVSQYAAQQQAAGAAALQQLYDDSAFWNSLYSIASTVATPVTFLSTGIQNVAAGAEQVGSNLAQTALYGGFAVIAAILVFKVAEHTRPSRR